MEFIFCLFYTMKFFGSIETKNKYLFLSNFFRNKYLSAFLIVYFEISKQNTFYLFSSDDRALCETLIRP